MKFMMQVIDSSSHSATADEMTAITAFNNQLRTDGHFIMAEGLESPNKSALIDNRGGADQVTNGPLHDSTEYVSGFWVIDAVDSEQAKSIALNASLACNRKIEIRPFIQ